MDVVVLDPDEDLIAERHRLGLDHRDEVWEGEYHMVPPPWDEHQRIGLGLLRALEPVARAAGLLYRYETGLYDPAVADFTSFRVPDQAIFRPEHRSYRGIEGRAELVIEIRSPGDESIQKVPFYQRVGVQEVLVIDRDTKALRHWARTGNRLFETDSSAGVALHAFDAHLRTEDGVVIIDTATGTYQV